MKDKLCRVAPHAGYEPPADDPADEDSHFELPDGKIVQVSF